MGQSDKLSVLHVVGAMNHGGTEKMLIDLYRNMDLQHIQFDFITFSGDKAYFDDEIRQLGGRVIRVVNHLSIIEMKHIMEIYGPYDIVHAHTLFHCGLVQIAARLAGVKVRISHAHTTDDDQESFMRRLYTAVMKPTIQLFSTYTLACSKQAGRFLFGERRLGKRSNYQIFPNVIHYQDFMEEPVEEVQVFKKQLRIEQRFVIGHIGRFIEPKNHSFLLDILAILRQRNMDVVLLLVGDGVLKEEIEDKAQRIGLEEYVHFTGIREDIPTMLHSMDLFVFPSTYEGLGIVLLEAQAAGKKCLVSEAIQPEADLQIGQMERCSLESGAEVWAEKIMEMKKTETLDLSRIEQAFIEKEYTLDTGVDRLKKLYIQENQKKVTV
ncbi:glycosyltransferase family 1 protein [Halalkalibacter sp. AB-rgal2]|uniref:glycosyltransferase family 1 protein n=1 Tax=Halalkalibacter sp. AB-rgal2 TaxID=3242695 RepID=UPI00359CD648